MRQVKVGIIGCGVIGRTHLQFALLSEHIEIVALADANREAAETAALSCDVPQATNIYDNGFALIDDPSVEAVILALPTGVRYELALYALGKGKHILLEKPAGMDASEVKSIIEARGSLVAASCSARFRLLESARVLTDFIRTGALGELRTIRYRSIKPASTKPEFAPYWRFNRKVNGGGIMVNWGTYDLDFLLGITSYRLNPIEVSARAWTVPAPFLKHVAEGSDAETHVSAFIRCESGAVITLERGECVAAQGDNSWEIIGEKGSLSFHMTPADNKAISFQEADSEQGVVTKEIWRSNENYDMIHAGLVEDFALSIIEGRRPLATLEEAHQVQKLIDAIYLSSATGRAVPIMNEPDMEVIA